MFRLGPDGNCSLLCLPRLPEELPLTRHIASAGHVPTDILVGFVSTIVVNSPPLPPDMVPQILDSTTVAHRHHLYLS